MKLNRKIISFNKLRDYYLEKNCSLEIAIVSIEFKESYEKNSFCDNSEYLYCIYDKNKKIPIDCIDIFSYITDLDYITYILEKEEIALLNEWNYNSKTGIYGFFKGKNIRITDLKDNNKTLNSLKNRNKIEVGIEMENGSFFEDFEMKENTIVPITFLPHDILEIINNKER